MSVFVVWHIHHGAVDPTHLCDDSHVEYNPDTDDEKLVGIYSSRDHAEQAVARSMALPGFRDEPECFLLNEHTLDEDSWTEGFATA